MDQKQLKKKYKEWLDDQYKYTAATKKNYWQQIKKLNLDDLNNELLKLRNTAADKSFNLTIAALKIFQKFLELDHPLIFQIKQLENIRVPRSQPHKPYTQDQVKTILKYATGWRRPALFIALYAGLRQNEIRSLNFEDVNIFTNEMIVKEGKGRKQRVVIITDQLKIQLLRWIQFWQLNENEIVMDEIGNPFLFTRKGTRPNLSSGNILATLSKKVGFRVNWHRCRSTYATNLYKKSKDVKLVQFQLGHTSSATTDRYIQRTLGETKEQITKIGDIYE